MDVAIEVADENEWVTLTQFLQDGSRLWHLVEDGLIATVGNATDVFCVVACRQGGVLDEVVELKLHFLKQQVVEVVAGEDDALLRKRALTINVGFAILLFAEPEVESGSSFPKHVEPMATGLIEGSTVVEDEAFGASGLEVADFHECYPDRNPNELAQASDESSIHAKSSAERGCAHTESEAAFAGPELHW